MKKEAITHGVLEDLANRNDNWDKLDGVINQVNELDESRLILKNEIVNGDFSDGTAGFTPIAPTRDDLTIVENGLKTTLLLSDRNNAGFSLTGINLIKSMYYIRVEISDFNLTGTPNIQYRVYENAYKVVLNTQIKIGQVSSTFQLDLNSTQNSYITIDGVIQEVGKNYTVKNLNLINLTQTFGAGNEPTKEEMDRLVEMVPNQWWDGELDLTQQQYVNWLLSFIREKANKQQEAWITPTLLNGWKSISGREVQYMKDEMGFVHFRGDLDPSTRTLSYAFSVPIGYRPSRNEYVNIGDTNYFIVCNMRGSVSVDTGAMTWQSLNYFTYRAK